MADCVLPEEIVLCILTRLPVKSLIRFKCVCKAWRELLATQKFIKMHKHQFSSNPKNQDFVIYGLCNHDKEFISQFSIEPDVEKSTNLDLPYHGDFLALYSVGCCNGLVCLCFIFLTFEMGIALWNPALRLSKFVKFPVIDVRVNKMISIGFGYDSEGDDFWVVKILCPKEKNLLPVVEVYSAKSDNWETIELSFQFRVLHVRNDTIVNGNPYWKACVEENGSLPGNLVWFDVKKLEFYMVPLSTLKLDEGAEVQFVDWKGSLAALVCVKNDGKQSVDVWVFDDGEMIWSKNHSYRPVGMKVDRLLQCSQNGKIIGDYFDGNLFVFDLHTGWIKEIQLGEGRKETFKIYGFSESLASIEGMEQIVVKKEKEEDDV